MSIEQAIRRTFLNRIVSDSYVLRYEIIRPTYLNRVMFGYVFSYKRVSQCIFISPL